MLSVVVVSGFALWRFAERRVGMRGLMLCAVAGGCLLGLLVARPGESSQHALWQRLPADEYALVGAGDCRCEEKELYYEPGDPLETNPCRTMYRKTALRCCAEHWWNACDGAVCDPDQGFKGIGDSGDKKFKEWEFEWDVEVDSGWNIDASNKFTKSETMKGWCLAFGYDVDWNDTVEADWSTYKSSYESADYAKKCLP